MQIGSKRSQTKNPCNFRFLIAQVKPPINQKGQIAERNKRRINIQWFTREEYLLNLQLGLASRILEFGRVTKGLGIAPEGPRRTIDLEQLSNQLDLYFERSSRERLNVRDAKSSI